MAEERNYYCICDDNCKFPTMTYEQIIEAITEATGNVPEHVEDAFITKVKESNHSANLTFWKGTQAEFNALGVTAPVFKVGVDGNGKLYFTPFEADDLTAHASRHASGGSDPISASDIGAMTGAETQALIDEVEKKSIVFSCGDGMGNTTTRSRDYEWLDEENLNIKLSDYLAELRFNGFGMVGNNDTPVAEAKFYFETEGETEAFRCNNWTAVEADTAFAFQYTAYDLYTDTSLNFIKQGGFDEISTSHAARISLGDYSDKVIKKIKVTAVNNNCNLQKCVIKFTKISGD